MKPPFCYCAGSGMGLQIIKNLLAHVRLFSRCYPPLGGGIRVGRLHKAHGLDSHAIDPECEAKPKAIQVGSLGSSEDTLVFGAGSLWGIAPLGLPRIRTCTYAYTARYIMILPRDGN